MAAFLDSGSAIKAAALTAGLPPGRTLDEDARALVALAEHQWVPHLGAALRACRIQTGRVRLPMRASGATRARARKIRADVTGRTRR